MSRPQSSFLSWVRMLRVRSDQGARLCFSVRKNQSTLVSIGCCGVHAEIGSLQREKMSIVVCPCVHAPGHLHTQRGTPDGGWHDQFFFC